MTITTVRKDALASIAPGEDDATTPHGSFHIVLSTAAKDRDGEELLPDQWEQPLPNHITMDEDHGMSVATTVGSGTPTIEDGEMHVRGTFASTPRAQEVRALVNEGHIRTTSVAFLRKTATDAKGVKSVSRELLNGAFVAVPANTEALVLASKSAAAAKEGRRNNGSDAKTIQAIHDNAAALGASCTGGKAATMTGDDDTDPGELAQAVDAALDQAAALLADVDLTNLPEPVQQALALMNSAGAAVDELLDALGVADPDEPDDKTADAADAAKAASAASAADLAALPDRIAAVRARALGALSDHYSKTGA